MAAAITCTPVLDPLGERIEAVLITFSILVADAPFSPSTAASLSACPPPASQSQPMSYAEPNCGAAAPRRIGAPTLTLELLRSLGDLPLYRAAERLGISPSTLKVACRRLGLARWPRAGGAEAEPPDNNTAAARLWDGEEDIRDGGDSDCGPGWWWVDSTGYWADEKGAVCAGAAPADGWRGDADSDPAAAPYMGARGGGAELDAAVAGADGKAASAARWPWSVARDASGISYLG
jgi:hypothetical protein